MKQKFLQSFFLQVIYKGAFRCFLKFVKKVEFSDTTFLKEEGQFIIIANHSSHWDTICLLASLPRKMLWKVKPVAAEDYFGNTKFRRAISNYFINTLLIHRKGVRDENNNPIDKMLHALDEGYSLILFPEGTRGDGTHMQEIKPGIARILSTRPLIKYIPVSLVGMRHIVSKEASPSFSRISVNFGTPTLAISLNVDQIKGQIKADLEALTV